MTRNRKGRTHVVFGAVLVCSALLSVSAAQVPDSTGSQASVAVVNGQSIYETELAAAAAAQLRQLYNQEYQVRKDALEGLVNQKVIQGEASRKGVPADKLLEQEVDAKLGEASDAEVKAYYFGQKDRLNRPFTEVEPQLRTALRQSRIQQARQDYLKGLRERAAAVILLRPPKVEVHADPGRLKGNPRAPITIVEFSDYQCPYCQGVETTLKGVLAKYEGQVSLGYRDFPLQQIHPQAQPAAEASRCAAEQGRFWEYHDLLLTNPAMLHQAGFVEHARKLQLDEKRFEACLTSGRFRSAVQSDYQDGLKAGVNGTPGFFVNGIFLNGNQPVSAFENVIEDELSAIGQKAPKP
jgi:protein-disulfide isomerase